jgi:hypothetical protein
VRPVKLSEVSEFIIKTYSLSDISEDRLSVTDVKEFDGFNLHKKLRLLDSMRETTLYQNDTIGLGDAFERAMNEMYNGNGEIALIIERRVITLDKTVQKKALKEPL